jgi:hypothetical protein
MNEQQRKNLITLTKGITKPIKGCDLDMGDFAISIAEVKDLHPDELQAHACGTSCCFAGHGPLLGIGLKDLDNNWFEYIEKTFGFHRYSDDFSFLFSPDWPDDREQCQARGYALLTKSEEYEDCIEEEDEWVQFGCRFKVPTKEELEKLT